MGMRPLPVSLQGLFDFRIDAIRHHLTPVVLPLLALVLALYPLVNSRLSDVQSVAKLKALELTAFDKGVSCSSQSRLVGQDFFNGCAQFGVRF